MVNSQEAHKDQTPRKESHSPPASQSADRRSSRFASSQKNIGNQDPTCSEQPRPNGDSWAAPEGSKMEARKINVLNSGNQAAQLNFVSQELPEAQPSPFASNEAAYERPRRRQARKPERYASGGEDYDEILGEPSPCQKPSYVKKQLQMKFMKDLPPISEESLKHLEKQVLKKQRKVDELNQLKNQRGMNFREHYSSVTDEKKRKLEEETSVLIEQMEYIRSKLYEDRDEEEELEEEEKPISRQQQLMEAYDLSAREYDTYVKRYTPDTMQIHIKKRLRETKECDKVQLREEVTRSRAKNDDKFYLKKFDENEKFRKHMQFMTSLITQAPKELKDIFVFIRSHLSDEIWYRVQILEVSPHYLKVKHMNKEKTLEIVEPTDLILDFYEKEIMASNGMPKRTYTQDPKFNTVRQTLHLVQLEARSLQAETASRGRGRGRGRGKQVPTVGKRRGRPPLNPDQPRKRGRKPKQIVEESVLSEEQKVESESYRHNDISKITEESWNPSHLQQIINEPSSEECKESMINLLSPPSLPSHLTEGMNLLKVDRLSVTRQNRIDLQSRFQGDLIFYHKSEVPPRRTVSQAKKILPSFSKNFPGVEVPSENDDMTVVSEDQYKDLVAQAPKPEPFQVPQKPAHQQIPVATTPAPFAQIPQPFQQAYNAEYLQPYESALRSELLMQNVQYPEHQLLYQPQFHPLYISDPIEESEDHVDPEARAVLHRIQFKPPTLLEELKGVSLTEDMKADQFHWTSRREDLMQKQKAFLDEFKQMEDFVKKSNLEFIKLLQRQQAKVENFFLRNQPQKDQRDIDSYLQKLIDSIQVFREELQGKSKKLNGIANQIPGLTKEVLQAQQDLKAKVDKQKESQEQLRRYNEKVEMLKGREVASQESNKTNEHQQNLRALDYAIQSNREKMYSQKQHDEYVQGFHQFKVQASLEQAEEEEEDFDNLGEYQYEQWSKRVDNQMYTQAEQREVEKEWGNIYGYKPERVQQHNEAVVHQQLANLECPEDLQMEEPLVEQVEEEAPRHFFKVERIERTERAECQEPLMPPLEPKHPLQQPEQLQEPEPTQPTQPLQHSEPPQPPEPIEAPAPVAPKKVEKTPPKREEILHLKDPEEQADFYSKLLKTAGHESDEEDEE